MSSSNTELNEHNIIPVLDMLRTSPKSEREIKLFEKIAKDTWGTLQLEGEPNPILLENMLIGTIKKLYDKPDSEFANDNARKKQARKHDVSLLMFGLLEGYYHTKLDKGQKICVISKIRYEQYLCTNVFTDLTYPGEGTYEEIKEADKKRGRKESRPLNLIESIAGDCKVEIGVILVDLIRSGNYKNCSQDAIFDKETGQRTDLPKPHYTLERFSQRGKENAIEAVEEQPETATAEFTVEPVPEANRVINPAPIEPSDSDSGPPAEQIQEPAPDLHSEASTSAHDPDIELTSESSMEATQESASETFSETTQEQPADAAPEPTPGSTTKSKQKSPGSNAEKGKPNRPSKFDKWIVIIVTVVAILFTMHARDRDQSAVIDSVKADEGGGIVNPNEISTKTNPYIAFPNHNDTKIYISSSKPEEIASVSVEVTYKDGSTVKGSEDLNGLYNMATIGHQEDVAKDFSGGVDDCEDSN